MDATRTSPANRTEGRRKRLFSLLEDAIKAGGQFARIGEIDERVQRAQAAIYLKHDVHGVSIDALVDFAQAQCELGLRASYFFMTPGHPVTRRHYSFAHQVSAMRALRDMGHEIGLHLDPVELIHAHRRPLRESIKEELDTLAREGLPIGVGNIHGNTAQPMRDRNGHTSTFEFFNELGRQSDFPTLANLPGDNAALIREHRCSIVDLGFAHWADMPMWSQRHRHIVTHFVSDNQLGKEGTLKFATLPDTVGRYKLMDHHPPRARMPGKVREFVDCRNAVADRDIPIGAFNVPIDDDDCERWFARLVGQPVLFLIHPEHYC